jgi:hypothetical protein
MAMLRVLRGSAIGLLAIPVALLAPDLPVARCGAVSEQLTLDLDDHAAGPLREIDGDYLLDLADALNRGRGRRKSPAIVVAAALPCRCDRPAVFAGEACLKCGRAGR